MSDRRLLTVALGAYGLDGDIDNRFFIKKVLEEGTLDSVSLANRLADKQYRALSSGFGFGDYAIPSTQISDFADKTLAAYRTRQFEAAVGEQDDNLRLALNAERELKVLSEREISNDTKWFSIMGSEPLRKVFEGALGLPSSFSAIDWTSNLSPLKTRRPVLLVAVRSRNSVIPTRLTPWCASFWCAARLWPAFRPPLPGRLR